MKTTKKQIDDLNVEVTVVITPEDYSAAEKKKLNERKRNAEFKGFRRGMAPMSLIQKVYGEQALAQSVDDLLSEALDTFIKKNKLRVLGQPLPSEKQETIEWVSGNTFTFRYDIATSPELTFTVSKDDRIPYYKINVTKEAKAEMKKNILSQYGEMQEGEATKENDYIIADLDNGNGVKVEGVYVALRSVAEGKKDVFLARKAGESFQVNVNEAFENETDRASMLKIKKEELAGINPEFTFTVVNVKTFVPAPDTVETWNKIYGEGNVKTAEEFDAKIAERIASENEQQANYRFARDAREYFVKKADIALPEAFLKRWLHAANEGKFTMEDIEKEFDAFLQDFRWQMVRGRVMELFGLKVEDKDIEQAAENYAAYQYAMYGMGNVPEAMIKDFAKRILADERQLRNLEEQVEDNKTFAALRENVTLEEKKISQDKFNALA